MAGEVDQAGRINPIGFAHRSPYSSAADVAATYVAKLAWRLCTAFPVRIKTLPLESHFSFSPRTGLFKPSQALLRGPVCTSEARKMGWKGLDGDGCLKLGSGCMDTCTHA